jgi:hypothetical protein
MVLVCIVVTIVIYQVLNRAMPEIADQIKTSFNEQREDSNAQKHKATSEEYKKIVVPEMLTLVSEKYFPGTALERGTDYVEYIYTVEGEQAVAISSMRAALEQAGFTVYTDEDGKGLSSRSKKNGAFYVHVRTDDKGMRVTASLI